MDQPLSAAQIDQLAAQAALDTFNKTVAESNLTGTYNGAPTEAAKEAANQTALSTLTLLNNARVDPFKYEAVARGVQASGLPNSIAALVNGQQLPTFQAPQAASAPNNLSSLVAAGTGGWTGAGSTPMAMGSNALRYDPTTGTATPVTNNPGGINSKAITGTGPAEQSGINADLATSIARMVPVNKLNAPAYFALKQSDPLGASFITSAYQAGAGIDPASFEAQLRATLPQFRAPLAGSVAPTGQLAG